MVSLDIFGISDQIFLERSLAWSELDICGLGCLPWFAMYSIVDTKEICKDKVDTIKRCVYVGYIWLRGDRMDSI